MTSVLSARPSRSSPSCWRSTRVTPGDGVGQASTGSTSRGRARSTTTCGRPAAAGALRASMSAGDDVADGAGAGDDEVALGQRRRPARTTARAAPDGRGSEPLGALGRAVDDGQRADAGGGPVAAARPLMPPAPTTRRATPSSGAEDGGRLLERDLHERARCAGRCRSRRGRACRPAGPLEQRVERLPDLARPWAPARASRIWPSIWASPTAIESRPQATVKACATARVVVAHVEVVGERLGTVAASTAPGSTAQRSDAGGQRERLADGGDGRVEGGHLGIDLEAVARREHDDLGAPSPSARTAAAMAPARSGRSASASSTDERGGVVRQADDEQAHGATTADSRGRPRRATCAARGRRGSAARSRGRRGARRRRSGTESTAGAKLRIELMPAPTRRVADGLGRGGRRRDDADGDGVDGACRSSSASGRIGTPTIRSSASAGSSS